MKRKLFIFLLLSTIICFNLTGQKLIFNTQDFPPFSYTIESKVSGPGVDIITAICKEAKIDYTFKLLPWSRALNEVETGKAHGLFMLGKNEEREKWFYFTPPIIKTEYGFFVNTNNSLKYQELSNIKGYTIGVYGPSNTSNTLEKIAKEISVKIEMTFDDESAFRKLAGGRIKAVFSNKDVGWAMVRKMGIKNARYSGRYKEVLYYIALSKQHTDKEVADKFIEASKKLYNSGKIQKILKSYQMDTAKQ